MPELPEVETTKRGLQKTILSLIIKDIWTDLSTKDKRQKNAIANPKFFKTFRKEVLNKKVLSAERRGKNILINLSDGPAKDGVKKTILIHMKMTGHLLYGKFKFEKNTNKWIAAEKGPLADPYNRFLHVVFSFSNGKNLAFSDARKFGKITVLETKSAHDSKHLNNIGPEPLERGFTKEVLKERLSKKPNGKIMTVLMDQSIVAGIGNIYSDEVLWHAGIHPERQVKELKEKELGLIFKFTKELLKRGIDLGGDSMSDYRNIYGERGKFQLHQEAYKRTGEKCRRKGCKGIILRKIINGRSAHYCSIHQEP